MYFHSLKLNYFHIVVNLRHVENYFDLTSSHFLHSKDIMVNFLIAESQRNSHLHSLFYSTSQLISR